MKNTDEHNQRENLVKFSMDIQDEIASLIDEHFEISAEEEYVKLNEELWSYTPYNFPENNADEYPLIIPLGVRFKILGVDGYKFYAEVEGSEEYDSTLVVDETFNLSMDTAFDIYNILRRQLNKVD